MQARKSVLTARSAFCMPNINFLSTISLILIRPTFITSLYRPQAITISPFFAAVMLHVAPLPAHYTVYTASLQTLLHECEKSRVRNERVKEQRKTGINALQLNLKDFYQSLS